MKGLLYKKYNIVSAISKMFVSYIADKGIRGSRVSSVKVTCT